MTVNCRLLYNECNYENVLFCIVKSQLQKYCINCWYRNGKHKF